jgi:acetyltransferase-like isoleucine patch superfamily enzyme
MASRPHPTNYGRPLLRSIFLIREGLVKLRLWFLRKIAKMDIHPTVKISLRANLDLTNPSGIHIDEGTYIAFHAVVFAHDMSRLIMTDTYIGKNCFIGSYSIIMPGVRVGDESVVGSGSVVTVDVPPHSIVGGNPAKILRSGIRTLKWGVIEDAYARAMATERDALRNGPLDEGLPVSAENPTVIRRGVYESKTG